jgi:hypothetical protein
LAAISAAASAQMAITEFMYGGADGEFIEFTNIGSSNINMTGWSFDDNHEIAGTEDLSAFGVVSAGQSVILTETDATVFRTDWGLANTVGVIGGNAFNLGRDDEINLYNASETLVDRLTYGDDTLGGPRANGVSAIVSPSHYGQNDITDWTLSVNGVLGAHTSLDGDIGSPGVNPTPEPATWLAMSVGVAGLVRLRKFGKR